MFSSDTPDQSQEPASSLAPMPKTSSEVKTVRSPTLSIVFQYGKVASTSLVATLNKIKNVEAVQSHFLGRNALSDVFQNLTGPDVQEYFFHHQLGQLVQNTRLTRRLSLIQTGKSSERLLILSVTREPLDWFRSVIVQDITGYLPRFHSLVQRLGGDASSNADYVNLGMQHLLRIFADIVESHGGIDGVLAKLPQEASRIFDDTEIADDVKSKQLFYAMLRPFTWFTKHFEPVVKVQLKDMTKKDGRLSLSNEIGDVLIIRYEDLPAAFEIGLQELGFAKPPKIVRKNDSKDKPFATEIRSCFDSESGRRLAVMMSESNFARQFGYGPEKTAELR